MSPAKIRFWRGRTETADARGHFDEEDYNDAGQWNTCAVGEQWKKFPKVVLLRRGWMRPRDEVLVYLGFAFHNAVSNSYLDGIILPAPYILEAYEILDLIEARMMVLKARAA